MTIDDNNPANGDFDDDDSFALENLDTYPGNLSAFIDITPSKVEAGAASADAATTGTGDTGESENDISDLPMESDSTYTSSAGTSADDEGSFQPNLRALEGDLRAESTSASDNDDDAVDTDDFVRQLQADLERSKAKKAAQSSTAESIPAAEPVKKAQFTSVEDITGTEEIDLSSIAAHHPSTYRQMEEAAAQELPAFEALPEEADTGYSGYAQMAASMSAEQPADVPKSEPAAAAPKKEKKNRKTLYMALAACAALLAIGYGGFSLYPLISQMFGSHTTADAGHTDSTKKHTPTIAHDSHETPHGAAADSVESDTHSDTSKHLEAEHHEVEAEPAKQEEHHVPEPTHATKEPVHETVKHETVKHEAPKVTPPHAHEPKKFATATPTPKPVAKEAKSIAAARNNNAPSTSESKSQIYTVQVYSSPSKDDADERLTRLKSRNATNATISEQMVRGQKWYRVRFGAFASRDEAESAARELGFAQCWIDRVR